MARSSGILMGISSLPSPYGIGTMGREARDFVDFLKKAGQKIWQVLPLGPTSFGDSPYQSFSAFAGNPYFIDLEELMDQGLVTREQVEAVDWGNDPALVDYEKIYRGRLPILTTACKAFLQKEENRDALAAFMQEQEQWIGDYALFMALKDHFNGQAFIHWPRDIRLREPEAMERYRAELKEQMELYCFIQYEFFRQWKALKAYANENGIRIMGDIPIYVPLDSADVWAEPQGFRLDEERRPRFVAGVPPDYFSADGQLWGNPLYDWETMREDGYGWWLRRIGGAGALYDMIRIDHFRGLASYWEIPYGEKTARVGRWVPGPGMDFISRIQGWFKDLELIAEDLGFLTEDVTALLKESGYPGMKVLQFAFDAREPSNYLPHTYGSHCICYTGTHDNTTIQGWFTEAAEEDVALAKRYLALSEEEGLSWGMIRGGMGSVAELFIAQMQDYLALPSEARMNIPGTLGGNNWRWRMEKGADSDALAERISGLVTMYGRQ